jgi:hypothetical protein
MGSRFGRNQKRRMRAEIENVRSDAMFAVGNAQRQRAHALELYNQSRIERDLQTYRAREFERRWHEALDALQKLQPAA